MTPLQITTLACTLAFALQISGDPPVRPQRRPEPAVRPTPSPAAQKEIDRVEEEMQGVWRMIELRSPDLPPAKHSEIAYCIVQGAHLSVEVHMDWLNDEGRIRRRSFESGFYHVEILEGPKIDMRSMISSFLDERDWLQFRPPGFERRYKIEIANDRMVWSREDGQRSVWERLPSTRAKRDAFGRLIKPAAEAEPRKDDPDASGAGDVDGGDAKKKREDDPPRDG